jgi:glycosyltransferase involved in cell wall biosynthesis
MEQPFSNENLRPLVSIITVVYNSQNLLEKTILSIINQTYTNIEYLIIDGASTDKTIDIIKKYETSITKWISEKDNGLYDAMNKGLKMASGNYVWFINSGDKIYSPDTLQKLINQINSLPDIIYGETEIIDINGNELGLRRHSAPDKLNWKILSRGMLVCHQSVLVKRELATEYNLKYRHSSDFDWLIRVLKCSKSIHNSKLILSKFLEGGQTAKNLVPGLKERFWIMTKYYGLIPTIFRHFMMIFRLTFYYFRHRRI